MRLIGFILSLFVAYALAAFVLTFVYLFVPPVSTVMMGSFLRGDGMARTWVPIDHISPNLIRAVLAAEDSRFCDHAGIDWRAVNKAINKAGRTGRKPAGASTITMQVARNLFLWNGRSYVRKVIEAPIALWLDLVWPKRRILEVYLNIAEWGDGIFGIEAAARYTFGVSAAQLNPAQAAMLVTMLPDPTRRSASNPGFAMRTMASIVLRRTGQVQVHCLY